MVVGIHLVVHREYTGHDWYRDRRPGFMYLSMMPSRPAHGADHHGVRRRVLSVFPGCGWPQSSLPAAG